MVTSLSFKSDFKAVFFNWIPWINSCLKWDTNLFIGLTVSMDTCNSSRWVLGSSFVFGTHHFLLTNNKECKRGTRDILVGTHHKFYPTRISAVSMIWVGQKRPTPKNIIFILSHILMVKAPYLKINKMVFFLKKKN